MDPDGIWEQVPPSTFRHSDTIGIIAFSYKNKKPTELTIATRTRNMSFPIVSETWYEDLQAEYIDPLDINRLQVFKANTLSIIHTHELVKDSEYSKICELDNGRIQITKWPYLKKMCLKVSRSNPKIWNYEDEENNFLFLYIISDEKCKLSEIKEF
ncbi:hypothetical protein TNCT_482081 [Trichonephila clavata]|uniref:Uncharacterized protein n=1 Tax=Trichonephila clavata TaxID=2740835 RepID=A0A8X6HWW8_TRICU|nr:hypothetical protein TNCT_482081 [Trichonephila clavata]